MGEYHDAGVFVELGQVDFQPFKLRLADHRGRIGRILQNDEVDAATRNRLQGKKPTQEDACTRSFLSLPKPTPNAGGPSLSIPFDSSFCASQ